LSSGFHKAIPVPEALVYYSKRGVYADPENDTTTPCAYVTALKLQGEHVPPGFLYPENMQPLENKNYNANLLLIDEHQPVSKAGWGSIHKWLAKGSRVAIYGGKAGLDWDTGKEQKRFLPEMEQIFGVKLAKAVRPFRMLKNGPGILRLPSLAVGLDIKPTGNTQVLLCVKDKPFVTIRQLARKSFAVYIAGPTCELPAPFLSKLCTWLLQRVGEKLLSVKGPLDVETCLFRHGIKRYLTVKNHSNEKRCMTFGVSTSQKTGRITDLMTAKRITAFRYSDGKTLFTDALDANSVQIYEVVPRGSGNG